MFSMYLENFIMSSKDIVQTLWDESGISSFLYCRCKRTSKKRGLHHDKNVCERMIKAVKNEDIKKPGHNEPEFIADKKASDHEWDGFIPKARFDQVNNEKKKWKLAALQRDSRIDSLLEEVRKIDTMKKHIFNLEDEIKKKEEQHAADLERFKMDMAVNFALFAFSVLLLPAEEEISKSGGFRI